MPRAAALAPMTPHHRLALLAAALAFATIAGQLQARGEPPGGPPAMTTPHQVLPAISAAQSVPPASPGVPSPELAQALAELRERLAQAAPPPPTNFWSSPAGEALSIAFAIASIATGIGAAVAPVITALRKPPNE